MKRLVLCLAVLLSGLATKAQMADPVHFNSELRMLGGGEGEIVFTATIDPGWHVYSIDLGQDGPVEATFNVVRMDGAELVGRLTPRGKVVSQYDNMFGMELRFFEGKGAFVQKARYDCCFAVGVGRRELRMKILQIGYRPPYALLRHSQLVLRVRFKQHALRTPESLPHGAVNRLTEVSALGVLQVRSARLQRYSDIRYR